MYTLACVMSYAHAAASSDDDEQDWSDWDEADDAEPTKSLFCAEVLPSARAALDHDTTHYGFDLRLFIRQVRLEAVNSSPGRDPMYCLAGCRAAYRNTIPFVASISSEKSPQQAEIRSSSSTTPCAQESIAGTMMNTCDPRYKMTHCCFTTLTNIGMMAHPKSKPGLQIQF